MKRKVKRYEGGGDVPGYEENPQPGRQTDRKPSGSSKKSGSASPRRVSSMEFIRKYEDSPASSRIRDEAVTETKKSRGDITPGRRFSGTYGETREALSSLSPEEKKMALKLGVEGAAGMALGRGLSAASEANLPLRFKQMMRRRATERVNEAERAADKAGEAARRGMSRRGVPRYDERYRAGEEGYRRRAEMEDAALALGMYRKGGSVKSSVSRRADGIAKKGKTRGRMI